MPRTKVGSLEIAYDVCGAGDPVLMLMGLGGTHHGWDLVRSDFARRHRLVLVDNRDAGDSGEATASYGLGEMAADALAVMDELGIDRFHVVGASMGGAIAQHLALQAPTRVASLVLASTWGKTDPFLTAVLHGWRAMVERLSPEAFLAAQSVWAFTSRYFQEPPAELAAWQVEQVKRAPLKSVAAYQRQIDACLGHDLMGMFILLRTPALVVVGEEDILTPPRYARALAAALPRGEVLLVPGTGHACFLETPKAFADRVLRFLGKQRLES